MTKDHIQDLKNYLNPVEFEIKVAGHCTHSEWAVLKGSKTPFFKRTFPASFAIIRSEQNGVILFDTGYSQHFKTATRAIPESFYSKLIPPSFSDSDSAIHQLSVMGINSHDVRHIVLSHFHGDHIAGLRDFPKARIHCDIKAYSRLNSKNRLGRVLSGFLKDLIPRDFNPRSIDITKAPPALLPVVSCYFSNCYDLFGDRSVIAVSLPGHAEGNFGILLKNSKNDVFFLVGDAAWTTESIKENIQPSPIALAIMPNRKEYLKTLETLHQLHKSFPEIQIRPCHCQRQFKSKHHINDKGESQ